MKKLNENLVSLHIGGMPVNELPETCPDKREYLPPKTQRTLVEAEGGFCAASGDDVPPSNTDEPNITIEAQPIGIISDYENGTVTGGDGSTSVDKGWDY
ncbi:MAG: hypothetical protein Q4D36_10405 [Bacteroidales bacterium]|nr:hypothetical protein [Bacteroidales bacterium]